MTQIPFDFDVEKHKIETKILVNLAISKLVDKGDKVNLVVGMPIEHWLDRERRMKYEQFIASKSQMSMIERAVDTPMDFKINKVIAVPERYWSCCTTQRLSKSYCWSFRLWWC